MISDTEITTEFWEPFIIETGERLLAEHGLDILDWTVKLIDDDPYTDMGFAGYCWDRGRVILLTREYLIGTVACNIRETLLHEIAHALTNSSHDEEWRKKFEEIGGTGLWYLKDGTTKTFPVKE